MNYKIEEILEQFRIDGIRLVERTQYDFTDVVSDEVRRFISKIMMQFEQEGVKLPYLEEFLHDSLGYFVRNEPTKIFEKVGENVAIASKAISNTINDLAVSYPSLDEDDIRQRINKIDGTFKEYNEQPNPIWIEASCDELLQQVISKYKLRENYDLMILARRSIGNLSEELISDYKASMDDLNKKLEQRVEELNYQVNEEIIKEKAGSKETLLKTEVLEDPFEEEIRLQELAEDKNQQLNPFLGNSDPSLANKTPEELVKAKYDEMAYVLGNPSLTQEQKDSLSDEIENRYNAQINITREKKEIETLDSFFL
jgi:hypothetical protein